MTRRMRALLVSASLVALLVVAAAAGAVYGAAHPSVTSTNTDAYRKTSANVNLSLAGGLKTTILAISLPAGQWVISADTTIYSPSGNGGHIRCALYQGSTKLDEQGTNPGNLLSGISLIGAVKSATSFPASLRCWHDDDGFGTPSDADAGTVLWAHRATNLAIAN